MKLLLGTGGLLAMATATAWSATYDAIPAPAAALSQQQEYVLYLGISVNGNTPVGTVPVKVVNDHFWVSATTLKQMWIPVNGDQTLVDVGQIADVKVAYDQSAQMLKLTVPDSWLPDRQ